MRIYKKGKNWYIDYAFKGKRRRKKIGHSKKIAELALEDVRLKIFKGEYMGIYEDKKVLFSDFAKDYLEFSKANKAPESYRRDINHLNLYLIAYFESKYLFEITSQMVEEYKAMQLEKVKPATVNRQLSCLKHLFVKAFEWGYVKSNPAKTVKKLKEPPGRVRYLTEEEEEALLRECASHIRPIVITALNTGMRKSEILGLKWSDVDLRNRTITIKKTKNNEIRTIPINDILYDELKKIPRHFRSNMIFCHGDGKAYYDIKTGFNAALRRAGINDFRFHDLRHTFASHLVMKGADVISLQQFLGHKDIKMTMRYSHLSKAHLQDTINLLSHKNGTILAQDSFKEKSDLRKSL